MLLVGTAAASTINVNTTGWWEEGNAFNASPTPIQSALNNATSGDTIRVVETASYSESISVTQNNLRLNLQGSTLDGSASSSNGVTISSKNEFTIGNGTIVGFRSAILTAGTVSDFTIDNIVITNPSEDGIQLYGHVTDFTISDSLITDPRYGIYSDNDFNTDGFNAINVTILNPGSRGIFLDDHNNNNIFTKDVYLEDVTVSNSAGAGIYIVNNDESSGNTTIVDSHISNCARAFQLDSGKGPILISNSTFIDGTDYGLYMSATSGSELTLTNNIISGNNNGLYLNGFSDFTFPTSNTVSNNGGYVFNLANLENVTIRDFVIDNSHYRGFSLTTCTNFTLGNISISGSTDNSILVSGSNFNITFEDLTITDPAVDGIQFYGHVTDFTISDSLITDPRYGIYSDNDFNTDGFNAINVTILNPGSRGIFLDDHNNNNIFTKDVYLEDVTVSNSAGAGIYIVNNDESSGNTTIVDSHISNCARAFQLDSGKGPILISNSTFIDGTDYGLYMSATSGSELTLTNNIISGNNNGLYLSGFSDFTFPTSNTFNNTGTAFSLTSTDNVTLQDIVINYPHTTGV
ncbi:hypothetical protein J2755_001482, partial [Methanohalophilus levihalophilus]|nr:hypothetical protein [Methanohalophilus levihalophilus]